MRFKGPKVMSEVQQMVIRDMLRSMKQEDENFISSGTTLIDLKQNMVNTEHYELLCTFRDLELEVGVPVPFLMKSKV